MTAIGFPIFSPLRSIKTDPKDYTASYSIAWLYTPTQCWIKQSDIIYFGLKCFGMWSCAIQWLVLFQKTVVPIIRGQSTVQVDCLTLEYEDSRILDSIKDHEHHTASHLTRVSAPATPPSVTQIWQHILVSISEYSTMCCQMKPFEVWLLNAQNTPGNSLLIDCLHWQIFIAPPILPKNPGLVYQVISN